MSDAQTEVQPKISQVKANPTLTIPESLDAISHEDDLETERQLRKDSAIEVEADAYTPSRTDVDADGDKETEPSEVIPEYIEGDNYPFKETEAQFKRSDRKVSNKPSPTPIIDESY